ncbi:TRAP transporter substrate-binding protein DctP [Chloroflexota bacterium]
MKGKVIVSVVAIIVLLGLTLAACASSPEEPAAPEAEKPAEEEEEEETPSAPEMEVITWQGQNANPAGSAQYMSMERVCNNVTKASGGRLVMKPFTGGSLVPANQEIDGVDSGFLDFSYESSSWWRDKWEAAGLFNFQVAGLSPVEMNMWMASGGMEYFQEMVDSGGVNAHLVAGVTSTPEIFMSTNTELKKLSDLEGLKIRTGGDDGVILSRMGMAVVSVPPGEIYEAMQRGVIDAFQLSSPYVDWTGFSTQEIADYIYLSPVRQPCEFVVYTVNQDKWAELPDDLKALMKAVIMEEAWTYLTENATNDSAYVQKYIDYGTNVAPCPTDIEEEMLRQADIYYNEKAAADAFYNEVYSSITSFRDSYRAAFPNGL